MRKASLVLIGAALLLACEEGAPTPARAPVHPVATGPAPSAPLPPTPDAPFRQQPPTPDGQVKFTPPKIDELRLKSGLRVLVSERHDLPIVSVLVLVKLGAGDVPDARPGALSFLGSMIEQGTKKRTALAISDDYEALGADHGAWFSWDSAGLSIKVLSDKLDPALEIMSDVLLNASFPNDEIERLRARRIAGIQSEKTSPGTVAQNALAAALFGRAHPYGHSLQGEEADAKKLTRAELVRAYERTFVPSNAAIIVAGDVTKDAIAAKLEHAFGAWHDRPGAVHRTPPKPPAKVSATKRVVFVDRPGAQSQVVAARFGVDQSVKERAAVVLTNAILGGMFSSRVNLNLREKHAYTYGARSYFSMRHGVGPMMVLAPVFVDKTAASIQEIVAELDGLRKEGPTAEELTLAKESIRLAMPGHFETTSDFASAMGELVTYDLPLDEYERRLAKIDAVTAADVKRVAKEFFDPAAMTWIVVGDRKQVAPQLDSLGFGPFEERDPYGNPVTSDPAKKP